MITGVVSYSDYLAAHRLHRRRLAAILNWTTAGLTFAGVLLIAFGNWRWGIITLGAGIGGLVGEFVQAHVFLPRKVRKLYAQYKGIASPITYDWDAESVRAQSTMGRGERKWKDYARVKEDNKVLLLYITDYLFEVVPKAWFKVDGKLEEFRKYAWTARET